MMWVEEPFQPKIIKNVNQSDGTPKQFVAKDVQTQPSKHIVTQTIFPNPLSLAYSKSQIEWAEQQASKSNPKDSF